VPKVRPSVPGRGTQTRTIRSARHLPLLARRVWRRAQVHRTWGPTPPQIQSALCWNSKLVSHCHSRCCLLCSVPFTPSTASMRGARVSSQTTSPPTRSSRTSSWLGGCVSRYWVMLFHWISLVGVLYRYAALVVAYWSDLISSRGEVSDSAPPAPKILDLSQPVYVFEMGSASARFAFMFIQAVSRRLKWRPDLRQLRWCYVLTDFVEETMRAW